MKVSPVSGPNAIRQMDAPVATSNNSAARDRAIQMIQGSKGQQDQAPVQNPNAIAPEEMSAIKASTIEQPNTIEGQQDPEDTQTATQEVKPDETKDPVTSKQWAQLVRQEKILRSKAQKQTQEFQAREEALRAREEALKAKEQEYSPDRYIPKSKLQQSTLEALAEAGVSYDQIVEQQLNAQNVNPQVQAHINKLEAQLAKLTKSIEEGQENSTKQQQQAYQAAVKQIRNDATKLVNSNPEFETIKVTGSVSDVVELIEKTYQEDGIVMTVEEACQEVENHLLEEVDKLTRIDKIKRRISQASAGAASSTSTQTQTKPQNQQTQPTKTLTNATGSTRPLSARERALLAFEGKLK